jgi:(2Fe-2S) ferredoxin
MPKFERHIFVCTNTREPGSARGCCTERSNDDLQRLFKTAISERGLKSSVRANKSGCLDQCEHGPMVVVYPEAVRYGGVKAEDVKEIVESHIIRGVPVARLVLREECINTPACPHKGNISVRVC